MRERENSDDSSIQFGLEQTNLKYSFEDLIFNFCYESFILFYFVFRKNGQKGRILMKLLLQKYHLSIVCDEAVISTDS